jgi:hypothetical protein
MIGFYFNNKRVIIFESHGVNPTTEILFLTKVNPEEKIQRYIYENNFELAYQTSSMYNVNSDSILKSEFKFKLEQLNEFDSKLLNRIKDRDWVFEKCCYAVPSSLQHIRQFIHYGITQTDHLSRNDLELEFENILNGVDDFTESHSPSTIFGYRKLLLRRLDFLNTFEVILGDSYYSRKLENGEPVELMFQDFTNHEMLDFALMMAEQGLVHTLEVLFTRHGKKLLPFRLSLLEHLPVLLAPPLYAKILPKIANHHEERWVEIPWHRSDWTADPALEELVSLVKESPTPSPNLQYSNYPDSADNIAVWYKQRITYLENIGISSNALQLANLAFGYGVKETESMIKRLKLSCYVIYDSNNDIITLDDLMTLPISEAISYFLQDLNPETICRDIEHFVIPLLSIRSNDNQNYMPILYDYLLLRASTCENFEWLAVLVKNSSEGDKRILGLDSGLKTLCIDCAYTSKTPLDIQLWTQILESVHHLSSESCSPSSGWDNFDIDDKELLQYSNVSKSKQCPLDALKGHVFACDILYQHGMAMDLKTIKLISSSQEQQNILVERFPRKSCMIVDITVLDEAWKTVLNHLLDLHNYGCIFSYIPKKDIYISLLKFALGETRFKFATSMLFPDNSLPPLPHDIIESIIIDSAWGFIDNAKSCNKNVGYLKNAISW